MIETNLTAKELEAELKKNREYCKKLIKENPMLKHVVYAVNIPKRSDITYASDVLNRRDNFYGMHIFNGSPVKFNTNANFDRYVNELYKEFGSDIEIYAVHNDNPLNEV